VNRFWRIYFFDTDDDLIRNAFLAGEMECNKTACLMILSKVVEDPQSGSCLNVSYADVSGPVANYNPTGSPYANHTGQHTPVQAGNFNSAPSLSSSITAGKIKLGTILWPLSCKHTKLIKRSHHNMYHPSFCT
jgi:hypothetical protein